MFRYYTTLISDGYSTQRGQLPSLLRLPQYAHIFRITTCICFVEQYKKH